MNEINDVPKEIAPDLNAIEVRLDTVECVIHLRSEQVDNRFGQICQHMDETYSQNEKLIQAKLIQLLIRVLLLTNVVAANHAEKQAVHLDRRLERIESGIAAKI